MDGRQRIEQALPFLAAFSANPDLTGRLPKYRAGDFNSSTSIASRRRVAVEIPVMPVARSPFDVSADGRLLLLERTISKGVPVAVVKDWTAGLVRP